MVEKWVEWWIGVFVACIRKKIGHWYQGVRSSSIRNNNNNNNNVNLKKWYVKTDFFKMWYKCDILEVKKKSGKSIKDFYIKDKRLKPSMKNWHLKQHDCGCVYIIRHIYSLNTHTHIYIYVSVTQNWKPYIANIVWRIHNHQAMIQTLEELSVLHVERLLDRQKSRNFKQSWI